MSPLKILQWHTFASVCDTEIETRCYVDKSLWKPTNNEKLPGENNARKHGFVGTIILSFVM